MEITKTAENHCKYARGILNSGRYITKLDLVNCRHIRQLYLSPVQQPNSPGLADDGTEDVQPFGESSDESDGPEDDEEDLDIDERQGEEGRQANLVSKQEENGIKYIPPALRKQQISRQKRDSSHDQQSSASSASETIKNPQLLRRTRGLLNRVAEANVKVTPWTCRNDVLG